MKSVVSVLFVVLLLVAAAFAVPPRGTDKEFKEERCLKKQVVTCKYYRVCSKNKEVCVSHKTVNTKRCKTWGHKMVPQKYTVCTQWNRNVAVVNKCVKCTKTATKTRQVKQAVCKAFHTEKVCTKKGTQCIEHKLAKKCWKTDHPFSLVGPASCPKGQMLQFKKQSEKVIARTCVKDVAPKFHKCDLFLDPHGRINNKRFEFQFAGDFIAAKTADGAFDVHVRMQRFNPRWTGTIGFAARVNGKDIVQYLGGKFMLNGSPMEPKEGVPAVLPNGGQVIRKRVGKTNNWNIEVFSPNKAKLLFVDRNHVNGNFFVYIPTYLKYEGICEGAAKVKHWSKNEAAGLFNFRYVETAVAPGPVPVFTEQQKKNARERCEGAGLKGDFLDTCIQDVLLAPPGEKQQAIEIEKQVKAEEALGANMKPQ